MDNELERVARFTRVAPVDLKGMFENLGIRYGEQRLSGGASGWIERVGDDYRIVVNASEPEVRKRFTAAHELAHYLLHRDLMDDGSRMNRHTDRLYNRDAGLSTSPFTRQHEVQANRLAAQIVMPAAAVRSKRAEGLGAAELARLFCVSRAAMEIRLGTLGLTG